MQDTYNYNGRFITMYCKGFVKLKKISLPSINEMNLINATKCFSSKILYLLIMLYKYERKFKNTKKIIRFKGTKKIILLKMWKKLF